MSISIANANLGNDLKLDEDNDLCAAVDGDLACCDDGIATLVQDIGNCLSTIPGEVFAHATSGAGTRRLLGEDDMDDVAIRALSDALLYDPWVAPRIDPDAIQVSRLTDQEADGEARFLITVTPLGSTTTSPINIIWNANTTSIESSEVR